MERLGSARGDAEVAAFVPMRMSICMLGTSSLILLSTVLAALLLLIGPVAPAGSLEAEVVGSASQVLWEVLTDGHTRLGFDTLGDEAFRAGPKRGMFTLHGKLRITIRAIAE